MAQRSRSSSAQVAPQRWPLIQGLAVAGPWPLLVVVHGHGGLDEASLSGPSQLVVLENGEMRRESLDPQALGLKLAPMEALAGGDLACNQAILEAVLQGRGTEAQQQVVGDDDALEIQRIVEISGRTQLSLPVERIDVRVDRLD